MSRRLHFVLDLCASLFGFALYFPILTLLWILLPKLWADYGHLSGWYAAACFLVLYLISLVGRCSAFLLDRKLRFGALRRRLLSLVPALLCAGLIGYCTHLLLPVYLCAVLGALAFAAFFTGSALFFYDYGEIFSWHLYLVGVAGCAVTLGLLSALGCNTVGTRPFVLLVLLNTVLLLFGLNQSTMDEMMRRRRHRIDQLPQKIRSYNLRLVAGIAVVLLLSLLLYRPIAAGVSALGQGAWLLLRALVQWLTRDRGESASSEPIPSVESQEPQKDMLNELDAGKASPFWDYLGYVCLVGVAILLICNYRKIFLTIVRAFRTLAEWISHLLHHARHRAKEQITDDYIDLDETVEVSPPSELPPDEAPAEWRDWKRCYRRYGVMSDSEERMRYGYRLILSWLKLQEVPLHPSDTTLEIVQTAEDTLNFADLHSVTGQYNSIRYGERTMDLTNPEEMNAILTQMAQTRTAVKLSRLARSMRDEKK